MNFERQEVGWLSDFTRNVYAARTRTEFSRVAMGAMNDRFRLIICACEELGHAGSSYALHGMIWAAPLPPNHIAYIHDHPVLPRVNALRPVEHVRGCVSRAALERTDYFNGIARPMGYKDHVILRAQGAPTAVTLSLCCDRVFTATECELLRMVQPHLAAAWQRVSCPSRTGGEFVSQRLGVAADLRPVAMPITQFDRLRIYFPAWRDPNRLPAALQEWTLACRDELKKGVAARPLRVLAVESEPGTLYFRYFPAMGDGAELRIMERPNASDAWPRIAGLSPRESEVLHWIAQGKRDGEIGTILGLAAKTVGKHVEHVLAKLGAPNRTAAVALGKVV